jgi:hypothetical protein
VEYAHWDRTGHCDGAQGQHDADGAPPQDQLDQRCGCRLARGSAWSQHGADGAQPRQQVDRRRGWLRVAQVNGGEMLGSNIESKPGRFSVIRKIDL